MWVTWVDAATGMALRSQMLDPVQGMNERMVDEVIVGEITFDAAIDAATFVVK